MYVVILANLYLITNYLRDILLFFVYLKKKNNIQEKFKVITVFDLKFYGFFFSNDIFSFSVIYPRANAT